MLNEFLQELMGVHSIPAHSHILSTLSLSNGGLGLQHPRLAAIPSFMLTIKRAINFAIKGVHLPFTPSAIQLPASLTNLYSNWDSECSTCRTFQAFQLYLPSITATIINDDPTATDSLSRADFDKFLHRTSFPWARETLRHHASEQYLIHLLESSPDDVLHAIPGMLLQHMSLPLVSMSRSNIKNRLDNKSFDIALKSKSYASPSTTNLHDHYAFAAPALTVMQTITSRAANIRRPDAAINFVTPPNSS